MGFARPKKNRNLLRTLQSILAVARRRVGPTSADPVPACPWPALPGAARGDSAHDRLGRVLRELGDPALLEQWRRLTTSDRDYYMCTKWFADGDVHKYFSPYDSPSDAFVAFMNVLENLEQRVGAEVPILPAR